MSSRSRTISDALRNTPSRSHTAPEEVITPTDNDFTPLSHNVSKVDQSEPKEKEKTRHSSGAEDLISRLSRLHTSDRKETRQIRDESHSEESEPEQVHRSSSRSRAKRYESEDESPPRRRHKKRPDDTYHRRRDDVSEEELSEEDRYSNRRRPRRDESPVDDRPKRLPHKNRYDDRYSEEERDDKSDEDYDEPRRSKRPNSTSSFLSLPKTTVTKIAKTVGVSSLSADIYDVIKDLAGSFINTVITDAARKSKSPVLSSADLEGVVERFLKQAPEDLERSEINPTTFMKWLKDVAENHRVSVKKEASLYLLNALEYYIITLFYNASDVAHNARRSRITSKDILLASRM